jgi:hypothetical protein
MDLVRRASGLPLIADVSLRCRELLVWIRLGGAGRIRRPSGVPPTAGIMLRRRELPVWAPTRLSR